MDNISQVLLSQGYKPNEVEMIMAVMNEPAAMQYAVTSQNLLEAYKLTQHYRDSLIKQPAPAVVPTEQIEKSAVPNVDLNGWFGSFVKDAPEDAQALSASLNKFSRYVQSMTDKGKSPE